MTMPHHDRAQVARIALSDSSYRLGVVIDSRLAKSDQMALSRPVIVELNELLSVLLPEGFVTDCHSVPAWLGGLLPEYDNRTNVAAVVHDYLYMHWETFIVDYPFLPVLLANQGTSPRQFADGRYFDLMNRFAPGAWRNRLYYRAVRTFGFINWRKFRALNQPTV